MHIEPRVPPGKQAFRQFRAEESLADKVGEDLARKEFSQPYVWRPPIGGFMAEYVMVLKAGQVSAD